MKRNILSPDYDWFFEALADGNSASEARRQACRDVIYSGTSWFDTSLALLALRRAAMDRAELAELLPVARPQIEAATEFGWRGMDDRSQISPTVWEWAACAQLLNLAKKILNDDRIEHLLTKIKNRVYETSIEQGMLTNDARKSEVSFELLFASVPLGLFEPEDLVLVQAHDDLISRDPSAFDPYERAMLAWYQAERGDFVSSRANLDGIESENAIARNARATLERADQISTFLIRHTPAGNGNRYEPGPDERHPLHPLAGQKFVVDVVANPLSSEDPVVCEFDQIDHKGEFLGDRWRFILSPSPTSAHGDYQFRFANRPDTHSERFRVDFLTPGGPGDYLGHSETSGAHVFHFADADLRIAGSDRGQFDLELTPANNRAEAAIYANDAVTLQVSSSTLEVTESNFAVRLENGKRSALAWDASCVELRRFADGRIHSCHLRIMTDAAEFFGLGERYNQLNQFGNVVDCFVYNQYKDQGVRTYMPIPVCYTNAGWGLFLNTDAYSSFDLKSAEDEAISVSAETENLRFSILTGAISDQVRQYIDLTGAPRSLPEWALGPWMSSNNWDSDAEVRRNVELTKHHGIPATTIVIEAWSDEATFYIFNDAKYTLKDGSESFKLADFDFPEWGRWPDPKGLIEYLHENDLRCIFWQIPIIKHVASLENEQKTADEVHFVEQKFGVSNPDGSPFRIPEGWFKDSLVIDFTNDDARSWWFDKRAYLRDELGVDGFKTDGGECIFGFDLQFAGGATGATMRNRYVSEYISSYADFAGQSGGIVFSRAGYIGAQSYPAHWAGDERSTWDAFERSLKAGLSSGLSGVIFWGWDLAGFSGPIPDAELFVRGTQMAAFCPIMQYHAESKAEFNQDRTPWNIADRTGDPRALDLYRFYANLRMTLLRYLASEAAHSVEARQPLMRALAFDFEEDDEARAIWDQYMLGRNLMIAPVITRGTANRSVYLPDGEWFELFTGCWRDKGRHEIVTPLEEIPVFVKSNTVTELRFDTVTQLGARMPSDIGAEDTVVLFSTVQSGCRVACDLGGGQLVISRGLNDGTVAIEFDRLPTSKVIVAFAAPVAGVTVNGQARELSPIALHKYLLDSVDVEHKLKSNP